MDAHLAGLLRTIDPTVLGARVRAARSAVGMTQSDLASREVTISYVSRIESGQRRPDGRVLVGLADRLGVSVDDLLGGAGEADDGETVDATRLALDYVELTLELGDASEALRRVEDLLSGATFARSRTARRARYLRARALEATARLDVAIDELELLLQDEDDGIRALLGGIVLCRCHREMGDNGRAIEVGEGLLKRVAEWGLEDCDEAIQLTVTLAAAYFEHGDVQYAVRLCRRAGGTADRAGSPKARASAYWNASVFESERGDLRTAVGLAGRALAMLGEGDDARNLARLRSQLGMMQLQVDPPDLVEAQANLERAAEELVASSAGRIDVLRNQVGLARSAYLRGDHAWSRQVAAEVLAAGIDVAPLLAADAHALDGQAAAALGDLDAAKAAYREAVLVLTGAGADRRVAQLWLDLGGLLESVGEVDASRDAYRSAAVSAGLRPGRPLPTPVETAGGGGPTRRRQPQQQ